MVLQLHGLGLQYLPRIVVKWGMDPNGYEASSMYTVGDDMARYENNGRNVNGMTESKWKKVFWGRPLLDFFHISIPGPRFSPFCSAQKILINHPNRAELNRNHLRHRCRLIRDISVLWVTSRTMFLQLCGRVF